MGLRCSLLGHTFDEQDVVREREDRGSEVLTVISEIERCSRCGAERVVSESTEITSVAGTEEVGTEEPSRGATGGRPGGTPGSAGGQAGGTPGSAGGQAGGTPGSAGGQAGGAPGGTADQGATGTGGGFTDELIEPPGDPAEEDAEILDDGEERAPGEWPDEAAGEDADESTADESTADEPTGSSTSDVRSQGGGEIIDADAATGETPDASADASADTSADTAADASADAGEADAADATDEASEYEEESAFEPMGSSVTVPEGHYECPDCGHTESAESSFRDGDACPQCREGYLEHREEI